MIPRFLLNEVILRGMRLKYDMSQMPELKCDVCRASAIGVASSSLGPVSFAYCAECVAVDAEPYGVVVGVVAVHDITSYEMMQQVFAPWFIEVLYVSVLRSGKTSERFWADVHVACKEESST